MAAANAGRCLFDSLGPGHIELELVRRLEGPGVMHLRYRVRAGLAQHRVAAIIEPFMVHRLDGKRVNDLSPDSVIRSIAIASGLGTTSAYSWLKIPVVEEMERVPESSTLPALLLGGNAGERLDVVFARWQEALRLPNVHGLVAGRNLLYPPDDDVAAAVDAAVRLLPGQPRAAGAARDRGLVPG